MTIVEKNKSIQTNIIKLYNDITQINLIMLHGPIFTSSLDGFTIIPSYIDIHLSGALYSVNKAA